MSISKYAKFLIVGFVWGFLPVTPGYANETHQFEASMSWYNNDSDTSEYNVYNLFGEYYFAPVDATDKPLAEAYFLDRIGSVALLATKNDIDFKSSNVSADGQGFGLGIAYLRPDLPFLFQAFYANSDLDYDPPYSTWKSSSDNYTVGVGYYLLDTLLTGISYQQVESELQTGSTQYDLTSKYYGVNAKYVCLLSSTTAYNLESRYSFNKMESISGSTDDDWSINLVGDYYFTNLISLGAGIEVDRGDLESEEGEEYLLRNKTFFTHNIGVELEYSKFTAKNSSGEDEDAFKVSFVSHF